MAIVNSSQKAHIVIHDIQLSLWSILCIIYSLNYYINSNSSKLEDYFIQVWWYTKSLNHYKYHHTLSIILNRQKPFVIKLVNYNCISTAFVFDLPRLVLNKFSVKSTFY